MSFHRNHKDVAIFHEKIYMLLQKNLLQKQHFFKSIPCFSRMWSFLPTALSKASSHTSQIYILFFSWIVFPFAVVKYLLQNNISFYLYLASLDCEVSWPLHSQKSLQINHKHVHIFHTLLSHLLLKNICYKNNIFWFFFSYYLTPTCDFFNLCILKYLFPEIA